MYKSKKMNTLLNSHRMLKIVLIMALIGTIVFLIIVARVTYITNNTSKKVIGAKRIGNADGDTKLNIVVALSQQVNRNELDKLISDLDSDLTGKKHNSMTDVINNTGATQKTIDDVINYFRSLGLTATIDVTRTYATIPMTADQASKIFNVSFSQYEEQTPYCQNNSTTKPGCTFVALSPSSSLHIPKQLRHDLAKGKPQQQIAGFENRQIFNKKIKQKGNTTQDTKKIEQTKVSNQTSATLTPPATAMYDSFDLSAPPWWQQSGSPEGCPKGLASTGSGTGNIGFAPNQIKAAYQFPTDVAPVKQSVVLVALNNSVDQPAVNIFANCFNIPVNDRPTFSLQPLTTASDDYTEASGDAQTLTAFGAGAIDKIIFINGNTSGSASGFFDVLSKATTQKDAKGNDVDIVSISYGACEDQFQTEFGTSLNIMETMLAKAALANITISTASGDDGSTECNAPMEPNTLAVLYPSSSAYVTSVGATNLFLDKNNNIVRSAVWNDNYLMQAGQLVQPNSSSSGGISKYINRPSWQTGSGVDVSAKRQVPDISYFGDMYPGMIVAAGCSNNSSCPGLYWQSFYGTSLSAPLFASVAAQYNARHSDAHIGYANKKLYSAINSNKLKIYDITEGNNFNTGTWSSTAFVPNPSITCCSAKPKYDLASGWGSIYVQSLIDNLSK